MLLIAAVPVLALSLPAFSRTTSDVLGTCHGPRLLNPRQSGIFMSDSDEFSLDDIVSQVQSNINEGELSKRGEGWFVAQAILLFGVLCAPAQPIAPQAEYSMGATAVAAGFLLGAAAVKDLGFSNLTPWPKPVQNNELKTEGVYTLCRHPMYTCLLSISFGLSLLSLSFERLLLTTALFALLSLKAGREEAFLNEKHEKYGEYAAAVPQFFPTMSALQAFVTGGR